MRQVTKWISDDGREFDTKEACRSYENLKNKNDILAEIANLDYALWKKFYPDYEGGKANIHQAGGWLNADVERLFLKFPDKKDDVLNMILNWKYGDEIFKNHLDLKKIQRSIYIRNDFLTALKSVKHGWELSSALGWSFSGKDLKELAKIHKSGECRKKSKICWKIVIFIRKVVISIPKITNNICHLKDKYKEQQNLFTFFQTRCDNAGFFLYKKIF